MTEPFSSQADDTRTEAPQPASADAAGVRGGDADERMDSPGEGSGGLPGAGADGETGAREALRVELGERTGSQPSEADGAS